MTTMQRPRAAIYARISRDIAGQGLGTERQVAECQALADRNGLEVVRVYVDNDISAFGGRPRPEFERMQADIRTGTVQTVVCWDTSRLLRKTRELEDFIDLCQPRNVDTLQVNGLRVDLSSSHSRAIAKQGMVYHQMESELKSERIKAQKRQAAASGKYLGGRVPYGWRKVDTITDTLGRVRGGQIVVDDPAAALIRSGTEAIVAGRSLISVTREWADAGAIGLTGNRMNTTQVRRILLRPRNAGLSMFHGQVMGNDWPAIVPLSTFRKMEAILTSPDRPRQAESKFRYLLSGVALCYCGAYMTGFGAPERRSYRCSVHQAGGRYIRGHANRAMGPLDHYVRSVTSHYLGRSDVRAQLLKDMQRLADSERPVESADIARLVSMKQDLIRRWTRGEIDDGEWEEARQEIVNQIAALEAVTKANGGNRAVFSALATEDPGAAFLSSPVEVQREILREVFRIQLRESGPYRGTFDPETVSITLKEAMDG
ncbi:hypothetical protein CVO76_10425 [Arthrobacter agilis]|uniref:Recombinase family protein n=1 Tax=Arthrobacter agilis TaxID=37921 RepID=A0A2L0UFJ7_9MICC|nr:recombinase family protein [Arthrobacter agilis]AUZ87996.1 hypothetical protein CVO76_10425 [Arthrobacter agilis]